MLPIACISEVFLPSPTEATWLRAVDAAVPVAPLAHGMEAAFPVPSHGSSRRGGLLIGAHVDTRASLWGAPKGAAEAAPFDLVNGPAPNQMSEVEHLVVSAELCR